MNGSPTTTPSPCSCNHAKEHNAAATAGPQPAAAPRLEQGAGQSLGRQEEAQQRPVAAARYRSRPPSHHAPPIAVPGDGHGAAQLRLVPLRRRADRPNQAVVGRRLPLRPQWLRLRRPGRSTRTWRSAHPALRPRMANELARLEIRRERLLLRPGHRPVRTRQLRQSAVLDGPLLPPLSQPLEPGAGRPALSNTL